MATEENGHPEEFIFDLTRKEEKVKIRDPASGEVKVWTLKETDGIGRDRYMTALMSRSKIEFGDGRRGKAARSGGLTTYEGLESLLISLMLHDENNQLVAAETIQRWPGRVQEALFIKCQEMSGLREEDLEEEKNSSVASD